MTKPLRIVVAGYAVGFPLGGQVWMMLHFAAGLARLGHDVLFLEETADWAYPFDPVLGYAGTDSTRGRAIVNLSGLSRFEASVKDFAVGRYNNAIGYVTLAATNAIVAKKFCVGDSGEAASDGKLA